MQKQSMKHSINKPVIEAHNVTVSLGRKPVVNNVSFSLKQGEIASIVGPNGAGKTTLVRAILGLIPYTGSIRLFGTQPKKMISKVGYVPQKFSFDTSFPLTVHEFLSLTLHKNDHKRIIDSLEEMEVKDSMYKMLGDLSGGQLQRVLIARALLHNPKILFLDEPTSGVDMEGARTFYEIIEHLNKSHDVTIVLISHEINMVYKFATYVICLNKDLYCKGVPKETITQEILRKLYGKNVQLRPHHHNH